MAKKLTGNNNEQKQFNSKEMFAIFQEDNFDKLLEFINKYGIEAVDRDGRNILLNCIIKNKTKWAINIINQFNELKLNSQGREGFSALHFAVQEHNIKILDVLLKNKTIIVDIQDSWGDSPLWRAIYDENYDENIIIKLLEAGADINKQNNYGVKANEYLEETMEKVNKYIKQNNIEIIK
jgi:ankyrin repeat protein